MKTVRRRIHGLIPGLGVGSAALFMPWCAGKMLHTLRA